MSLNTAYPNHQSHKATLFISLALGVLLYLLLVIYQPFGTYQFTHHYKYLLLIPYAIIGICCFAAVNLALAKTKIKWTIGAELAKTLFILWLISIFAYLYNTLYLSKVQLSFTNYLYMLGYTIALVLPISLGFIMAKYIYYQRQVKTDTPAPAAQPLSDQRLRILANYGNAEFFLDPNDFIYAEAADNYCTLYFYQQRKLCQQMIRISLHQLIDQIATDQIRQVHRSYVVNLGKVKRFKGNAAGYKISLDNVEKELSISRNYLAQVLPKLKELAGHP